MYWKEILIKIKNDCKYEQKEFKNNIILVLKF